MSNHTPGPWRQHSQAPDRIIVNGSCVYRVRDMTTNEDGQYGRPNPDDVALMAAAPELLAALKKAVAVMRDNNLDESMAGEFELFTDAITKAEGRDE